MTSPSSRPLFSVVIPTRERAETLRSTLQTCLAQDFDDYEIVVCDNHSSPATREVVDQADSPRIRYLRTDRPLAMSANWEYALSETRGDYLTVVGDDDGLMPYALRELAILIERYSRPSAVTWRRGIYTWPTMAVPEDANYLHIPLGRTLREISGKEAIADVIAFRTGADLLPMIYSAVVRRDLVEDLRERVGRVFPTIYPDVYSGFALAWLSGTYLSSGVPMGIAGLGGQSNGVATLRVSGDNAIADEFASLNAEFDIVAHPRVPDLRLGPVHVVDSFEWARQCVFPETDLDYDRRSMVCRYLESMTELDPAVRKQQREVIRATLQDDAELLSWFDREAPDPPPRVLPRLKPAVLGPTPNTLAIDAAELGLLDIAGATRVSAAILGVGAGPIVYSTPPARPAGQSAQAAAAQEMTDLRRRNQRLRQRCKELEAQLAAKQDLRSAVRGVVRRIRRRVTSRR
ncbi:glycosyltransferase family 2 protein [Sporichthya polymorpha]|uniref:glycosyltransferase family 2 protein n=1 Tax=Sporichthya polymorpha TaxID=35751 RepID=UPI00036B8261|nr:glycosyltransferase family 2 protein [Sporichthya polymorpha]